MSDTVLKVEGLYKKFCQSLKRSLLYGTIDATKSMFGVSIENLDLRKKEFWALQDINFELKRGETLGLIGQNGSGKTTLLRLINGIFPPDKGRITINGRIGALIAVGAGFHPHMTGRENIYLNGTIQGMTKAELKRKKEQNKATEPDNAQPAEKPAPKQEQQAPSPKQTTSQNTPSQPNIEFP